jgi:hypothetical protein
METQNEFVHDLVFPDGAGDGRNLRVLRDLVYEMLTVSLPWLRAQEEY